MNTSWIRSAKGLAGAAALALVIHPAQSADLNGAWTSDRDSCTKVFATKGKKISFHRNADVYGSGFIIEGERIRGRTAKCKVVRKTTDQALVHMIASCATDIMLSSVQLSVRVVSDDEITRLFPGISGMEITYYRCPVGSP